MATVLNIRRVAALGVFAAGVVATSASASDDFVTITVDLPFPAGTGPGDGVFYRLAGQSAFYSLRTGSFTTGGLLDGLGSSASLQDISFQEFFPEVQLTDYLEFGYFGVLETVVDGALGEEVVDRSLVVAGQAAIFEGLPISSILPFLTESELVDALTGGFDTPQFFDALFSAVGNPDLLGDLTLLQQAFPGAPTDLIRDGESLGLYGFIRSVPGEEDQAVWIGGLSATVLRVVPAPTAAGVWLVGGLAAARRRRVRR
ncbi:MAG: hypothetical protein ACF8SC_02805 [Phycisphaerales bacterium JB037]